MTDRRQIQGYNLIQCSEISSSSDVFLTNFNNHSPSLFPNGRFTYRRLNHTNDNPVNIHIDPILDMPEPGIPRNDSLSITTSRAIT